MNTGNLTPDTGEAIEFLKAFHPQGPWCLTAISPNQQGIQTRTFMPAEEDQCAKWISARNGEQNLYFSINAVAPNTTRKAAKEDIVEVRYLHVDIDARVGEPVDEERERIARLISSDLPSGVPSPTCVVDSGGGYWGFWRLEEPLRVKVQPALIEQAEGRNQMLANLLGGDAAQDISRIARLPGTLNLPNAAKLKKDRRVSAARLISIDASRVYPIVAFGSVAPAGTQRQMPSLNEIAPRALESLDQLDQWGVEDRIKIIIVQGRHPDEAAKTPDDSRSAWLFDAVCGLVRKEVPDEVILGIILDPDNGVSGSVLDKGGNAQKYARRQIDRAKDMVVAPELLEMNEKHVAIGNFGGKFRIADLSKQPINFQTKDDFSNRYSNRFVAIGPENNSMPLAKWWLSHPRRNTVETVVFAPNENWPGTLNLWRGFGVEPVQGDCGLFWEHVKDNVCAGDEAAFVYLRNWMARAVQRPQEPGQVAIVLQGGKGTGKSMFARIFGKLFGPHFLPVSDARHLVGQFNAPLRQCVLLFADEAFFAGDKKNEGTLKALITEPSIVIEPKGVDATLEPNRLHIIMASNNDWVVPASSDERRYLVLKVAPNKQKDTTFFGALMDEMENGGYSALLHELMSVDLAGFDVRDVPITAALKEQQDHSMGPVDQWLRQLFDEGVLPGSMPPDNAAAPTAAAQRDIVGLLPHARLSVPDLSRASGKTIAKPLRDIGAMPVSLGARKGWRFPPLSECRAAFEAKFGPQEWSDPEERDWRPTSASEGHALF